MKNIQNTGWKTQRMGERTQASKLNFLPMQLSQQRGKGAGNEGKPRPISGKCTVRQSYPLI